MNPRSALSGAFAGLRSSRQQPQSAVAHAMLEALEAVVLQNDWRTVYSGGCGFTLLDDATVWAFSAVVWQRGGVGE